MVNKTFYRPEYKSFIKFIDLYVSLYGNVSKKGYPYYYKFKDRARKKYKLLIKNLEKELDEYLTENKEYFRGFAWELDYDTYNGVLSFTINSKSITKRIREKIVPDFIYFLKREKKDYVISFVGGELSILLSDISGLVNFCGDFLPNLSYAYNIDYNKVPEDLVFFLDTYINNNV